MKLLTILKATEQRKPVPARKSRPAQGDFNRMVGDRRFELRKLIQRLQAEELTVDEFADLFDAVLLEAHTSAWVLGRQRAGDLAGESLDDVLQGIAHKDPEAQWLQRFMRDIADGDVRYVDPETGEYRANPIFNRANLYIKKARGTANEAFVETSPSTDKEGAHLTFTWVLGANEQHCADCPQIAALSPFTKDTMFAYPGSGDTACLGNCKCHIVRSDDIRGFLPA